MRFPGNKTPGKPCPPGVSALAGAMGKKCNKVNARTLKGHGASEGDKCPWGTPELEGREPLAALSTGVGIEEGGQEPWGDLARPCKQREQQGKELRA